MPIYKVQIQCTTIAEVYVDADSEDEAKDIASDVPSSSYKEEVEATHYEVVGQEERDRLKGRYVNCAYERDDRGFYKVGE